MSTWVEGRTYDYYGRSIVCVRRWFDGPLEMVDLAPITRAPLVPEVFTRAARTLATCVFPRVTATLGGVCLPGLCHHDWYFSLVADAGPSAGLLCCESCGVAA